MLPYITYLDDQQSLVQCLSFKMQFSSEIVDLFANRHFRDLHRGDYKSNWIQFIPFFKRKYAKFKSCTFFTTEITLFLSPPPIISSCPYSRCSFTTGRQHLGRIFGWMQKKLHRISGRLFFFPTKKLSVITKAIRHIYLDDIA